MKKMIAWLVCLTMVVGLGNTKVKAQKDFIYEEMELIIYDSVEEYIAVLNADKNMSKEERDRVIEDIMVSTCETGTHYEYGTLRQTAYITSTYSVQPYFRIKFLYIDGVMSPEKMVSIQHANIDLEWNGTSYGFDGTFFYELEAGNQLYWDINGHFYFHEECTFTPSVIISIGEYCEMRFNAAITNNHYTYKQVDGTYRSSAMQP